MTLMAATTTPGRDQRSTAAAARKPLQPPSILSVLRGKGQKRIDVLLDLSARYGDVVRLPRFWGLIVANVITSPAIAHQVLVEQADAFVKGYGLSYFARPLLGNGLLTSENDVHRRQRRMMAPAFVHKRIADYAAVIAARTEAAQEGFADGATVDLAPAMMRASPSRSWAPRCSAPRVGPEGRRDRRGASPWRWSTSPRFRSARSSPSRRRGRRPPTAAAWRPSPASTAPSIA